MVLLVMLMPVLLHAEVSVSDGVDVAPDVKDTRTQMWPRAAWSAEKTSWLVAWREGDTSEFGSDIWCARVTADGKALDVAGIKVCAATDNQERPWVASDGTDFLVVWEDFRNGKEYDVYAARVSADGKVLDPDGFLVAGGAHNQCHPVVAFVDGHYMVVWQSFVADAAGRYLLYGARLSKAGKLLDPKGVLLTPPGGDSDPVDAYANAANPVIAPFGDRLLMGYLISSRTKKGKGYHGAVLKLNARTGASESEFRLLGPGKGGRGFSLNTGHRMPTLACGVDSALYAAPTSNGGVES